MPLLVLNHHPEKVVTGTTGSRAMRAPGLVSVTVSTVGVPLIEELGAPCGALA